MDAWGWSVSIAQGLISSWLFRVFEIVAIPWIVTKAVGKNTGTFQLSRWQKIAVGTIVLAAILVIHDRTVAFLSHLKPQQYQIREWLDGMRYSSVLVKDVPKDIDFIIDVSGDLTFQVLKPKELDEIIFQTVGFLDDSIKKKMSSWSSSEKKKFFAQMEIDLGAVSVETGINYETGNVILLKRMPFDASTRRYDFGSQFFQFKRTALILNVYVDAHLNTDEQKQL